MDFKELATKKTDKADFCPLVKAYTDYIADGGSSLYGFLSTFLFHSEKEIESACRKLITAICTDGAMVAAGKATRNADEQLVAIYTRASKIYKDENRWAKFPSSLAGELWHGKMSRAVLDERVQRMFNIEPDPTLYAEAAARLQDIYGLTDLDIEKLHYFVEQVKDGEDFPPSLRRMLYIWGNVKKSGKSTMGGMITALLNGDDEVDESGVKNISKYKSTLAVEMQIGAFSVPAISRCNCVLMDECFYSDMGKTYNQFKDKMTSNNGKARLPYGQEFQWIGQPNYIATSNDDLTKFIMDDSDRRFLSIHLQRRPKEMPFCEILQIIKAFVLNSQRTKGWQDWTKEIFDVAEEKGIKADIITNYYIMLTRSEVLGKLSTMPLAVDKWSSDNKFTIADWKTLLADRVPQMELVKQTNEIRAAAEKIVPKYSKTNYWLKNEVREKAQAMMDEAVENITKPKPKTEDKAEELKSDLPF